MNFEVVVCRELVNANQSVDWGLFEVDELSSGQEMVKMEELIKVDDRQDLNELFVCWKLFENEADEAFTG